MMAEAVMWLLMNSKSSSQNAAWLRKVTKIRSTEVKQAVLLKNLLSLLSFLIRSIPDRRHDPHAALHPDQAAYFRVVCLAKLCDYEPSTGSFWKNLWHNKVTFPCLLFPRYLGEKLQQLRDCHHYSQDVQDHAKQAIQFSDPGPKVSEKSVVV